MSDSDGSQGRHSVMDATRNSSGNEAVWNREALRIAKRRDPHTKDEASSSPDRPEKADAQQVRRNLVGIALSGGGIRAGAFSLGFLMGLCRSGMLRFVDYVSTVSGGGYAAATMSAEAVERQRRQKDHTPSDNNTEWLFEDPAERKIIKPRCAANHARPTPLAVVARLQYRLPNATCQRVPRSVVFF